MKVRFGSLNYGDKCLFKYGEKIYKCFKGKAVISDINSLDGLFALECIYDNSFTFLPLGPDTQVYYLPYGVEYNNRFSDLAAGDSFIRHNSNLFLIKFDKTVDIHGLQSNCLDSCGNALYVYDYEMVFKIDPKGV